MIELPQTRMIRVVEQDSRASGQVQNELP